MKLEQKNNFGEKTKQIQEYVSLYQMHAERIIQSDSQIIV